MKRNEMKAGKTGRKRRPHGRRLLYAGIAALMAGALVTLCVLRVRENRLLSAYSEFSLAAKDGGGEKDYIKWVEFNVPLEVLEQALTYDIDSHLEDEGVQLDWIELLAYTAAKCGGQFRAGAKSKEMAKLVERRNAGETMAEITDGMQYYSYYKKAYSAILSEFVGEYATLDADGNRVTRYGLKACSPIAKGYGFGHYDDFGTARTYGYKRLHLGNDLLGSIGTPIIAVEGGVIEALGWNQYGGWRVGIRSHDSLRYYYYAHLRKDHPWPQSLKEGDVVEAGDVIGYMGMTGYSKKENVNNIKVPHLHFGLQLIFDESQKDGTNQIWLDVYAVVKLLQKHRVPVEKIDGECVRADGGGKLG